MARKPNDGRGRLGGRQKGTTNKDKPFKTILKLHSEEYFTPHEVEDENGNVVMMSQYDMDIKKMKPAERVSAELQLLKYHTPQMQATAVDVTAVDVSNTISDRLTALANGEEIDNATE